MSLLTCTDCRQPVSSEAVACPTCGRAMRDASYLTPRAQILVGGIVLVAGFAWPPLFFIVFLVFVGRFVAQARGGGKLSSAVAIGLVVALTVAVIYLMPSLALIASVVGAGTVIWQIGPLLRRRTSPS